MISKLSGILSRITRQAGIVLYASVLASVMVIVVGFSQPVQAITLDQLHIFHNDIDYYNFNEDDVLNQTCGPGGANGDVALVGSDNVEKAFHYFVARGLSAAQSAGIVGNLIAESGVNPLSHQNGGGKGRGIAQWETGGRWDTTPSVNGQPGNVVAFAASKNKPQTDLGLQLDFVWHEMSNIPPYNKTLPDIKATTTYGQAAVIFLVDYERAKDHDPNGNNARIRTANAGEVMARYGGVLAGGGGNSPVATLNDCTGATANCDQGGAQATGKAAILCEARKFDPFGYLWGGGHGDPEAFMAQFNAAGGFTQPFKQVVDCSGLEVVAIWNATHQKVIFNTATMASTPQLHEIPISQTVPGDFVYRPGHTEIVATPGAASTFGAHTDNAPQEKQIGDAGKQSWTKAYELVGVK